MVFPVGPGNAYPNQDGGQSIANATAEIMAANHPDMRMWAVPSTANPGPPTPTGPNGYNGSITPVRNLTGGCNMTCSSPVPFPVPHSPSSILLRFIVRKSPLIISVFMCVCFGDKKMKIIGQLERLELPGLPGDPERQ